MLLAFLSALSLAIQQPSYHVVARVALPGEGGWDYLTVDTAAHRLYASRGTHVAVVDLDRDSVVGDIPNTLGVHGIVVLRDLNRGFTSNGRDSTVTVFDLKTLAAVGSIKVTGRNPDAIAYDPVSRRLFTFNGGSANLTAIDPRSGKIVGALELGGKPEFAQTDGRGRMFVNIEDKSELVAFDGRTLATSFPDGRERALAGDYDVVILDMRLPGGTGFELCAELRRSGVNIPVLMLTALDAVDDRVRGLAVGADDYLTKPFAFRELVARLQALARRRALAVTPASVRLADLEVDLASRQVRRSGRAITLTAKEFALLELLLRHPEIRRASCRERV